MNFSAPRKEALVRAVGTLAVIALSGGILAYLIYSQRSIFEDVRFQIEIAPLLIAFVVFSFDLILVAAIWGNIMNTLGGQLPIGRHIRIYCLTNLARRIPGTIWYIASRAQIYRREQISRRLTAGASGIEFSVSVLSSAIVALVFGVSILAEARLNLIGLLLLAGLCVVASHPRVIGWIFRRAGVPAQAFSQKEVFQWVGAYLVAWVLSGIVVFAIARGFTEVGFENLWYVIGSVSVANIITSLLFFAPTNLGITEVSLSLLLARVIPAPYAVLAAVATRILIILFESFWAIVCIWLDRGGKSE
jgi:hypothetical protein